jgi:hypothetical protein
LHKTLKRRTVGYQTISVAAPGASKNTRQHEGVRLRSVATTTIDARRARHERHQRTATLTARRLAAHLGLTRQRLAARADETMTTRLSNGRCNDTGCRLRNLNWLCDAEPRSARPEADTRVLDAKAELLRPRIAEKSRSLIPKHEVDKTINAIAGIVTTPLGGMAAHWTPDLSEAVVRQVHREMAVGASQLADQRGEAPLD